MNPSPREQLTYRSLSQKYARPGPRYTSYPTAVDFAPTFTSTHYLDALSRADIRRDDPLSLYLHIPFCQERCRFCACSVVASPEHDRVVPPYLQALFAEFELVAQRLPHRRTYSQLHLGGGTPTYLAPDDLAHVYQQVHKYFQAVEGAESSIELDPRVTSMEHLDVLAAAGVNRISVGVQDFDPHVQEEIGRIQSFESTRNLIEGARSRGISQVNVDLVYGLPGQTLASMQASIGKVLALAPDRVALYGYAHVPSIRGNQKKINTDALPTSGERLELFLAASRAFVEAGFEEIGMDHFARPDDPLSVAARDGTIRRNFMGYTTQAGNDIIGFGVTAIGEIDNAFAQNSVKLKHYQDSLAQGILPTEKGLERTSDDSMRARVIADLMCRHRCDLHELAQTYGESAVQDMLGQAQDGLQEVLTDGLLEQSPTALVVTELGRLFVRNIAMCFDNRLRSKLTPATSLTRKRPQFSQTV